MAVCMLPGLVVYDPMQFSMLHKVVLVVLLLLAFTPRSAVFVCVAVCIYLAWLSMTLCNFNAA